MKASIFWSYSNNSSEEKNAKKETTSVKTIGIYELCKEKKKGKKGYTNHLWIRSKRQKKECYREPGWSMVSEFAIRS